MSWIEIKEIVPTLNSRSAFGRVVVNPPPKVPTKSMEVHATDKQIRLCCGRAFLTFEGYLKHKEESPSCAPGLILEPLRPPEDCEDEDDEEEGVNRSNSYGENEEGEDDEYEDIEEGEANFHVPVIDNVSSMNEDNPQEEEDASDNEDEEYNPIILDVKSCSSAPEPVGPMVSEALKRLNMSPIKLGVCQPGHSGAMRTLWSRRYDEEAPTKTKSSGRPSHREIVDDDVGDSEDSRDSISVSEPEENTSGVCKCSFAGCKWIGKNPKYLKRHLQYSHDPKGKFPCDFCCCRFPDDVRLDRHTSLFHYEEAGFTPIKINDVRYLQCNECSQTSRGLRRILDHVKDAHQSNGQFKCQECSCAFMSSKKLKMHFNFMHPEGQETKQEKAINNTAFEEMFKTVSLAGRIRFKCKVCGLKMQTRLSMNTHIKKLHNGKDNSVKQHSHQRQGEEEIGNPVEIPVVKAESGPDGKHECSLCDFYTTDKATLNRHLKVAHDPSAEFPCKLCNCRYSTQKHLDSHIKFTHAEPVPDDKISDQLQPPILDPGYTNITTNGRTFRKCQLCPYTNHSVVAIEHHLRGAHVPNGKWPCNICNLVKYKKRGYLKQHIKLFHSKEYLPPKTESCSTKLENTTSNHSNANLVRIGSRFKCSLCSYVSAKSKAILHHIKVAHVPNGDFKCSFCSCCFRLKSSWGRHIRRAHPDENWEFDDTTVSQEESKPSKRNVFNSKVETYTCDVMNCLYSCVDVRSLKRHKVNEHSSSSKFACSFPPCPCGFSNRIALSRHLLRVHQYQKNSFPSSKLQQVVTHPGYITYVKDNVICYQCSTKGCSFRPKTSTQIKWHIKNAHNMKRRYACNHCSSRFDGVGRLQLHLKMYHSTASKRNTTSKVEINSDDPKFQPVLIIERISSTALGDKQNNKVPGIKTADKFPVKNGADGCPVPGCPVKLKFRGLQYVSDHISKAHSSEAQFRCGFCPNRYFSGKYLNAHITMWHKKFKNSNADATVEVQPKNENAASDVSDVIIPKSKCSKCDYEPICKSHLTVHEKVAHVRNGPHKCNKCPCRFATKVGLVRHLMGIHSESPKSKAGHLLQKSRSLKKKSASASRKLRNSTTSETTPELLQPTEKVTVERANYSCDVCQETFATSTSRNWHIKCAHSKWIANVKRYPCDLCPNVYDSEGGLKVHKCKSHGRFYKQQGLPGASEAPAVSTSPEKSGSHTQSSLFVCSKCDFATKDKAAFDKHDEVAHVPNGMKCNWCSCTFATKMNQVLHQMAQHPNAFDTKGVNWFQRKIGISTGLKVQNEGENSSDEENNGKNEKPEEGPTPKAKDEVKREKEFRCSKCSYVYKRVLVGQVHEKTAHFPNGVPCPYCPCTFRSLDGMNKHERAMHKDEIKSKIETPVPAKDSQDKVQNDEETTVEIKSKVCSKRLKNKRLSLETVNDEQSNPNPIRGKNNLCLDQQTENAQVKASEEERSKEKVLKDNAPKSFSPKTRPMRCNECNKICRGPDNLQKHRERHHRTPDVEPFENTEIEITGESSETDPLPSPEKVEYEEEENFIGEEDIAKIYRCTKCVYSTDVLRNMKSHSQTSHANGRFRCECGCTFEKRINLVYHMAYFHQGNQDENGSTHESPLIGYDLNGVQWCQFCRHSCSSYAELESHYIKCHENKVGQSNPESNNVEFLEIRRTIGAVKVFMRKKKLPEYYPRKIHSCGTGFSDPDALDAVECTLCHQIFKTSNLLKHVQLCHSTVNNAAKCKECSCSYATRSALQKHVAWSHKIVPSTNSPTAIPMDDTKPFKCSKCGLRFESASFLEKHMSVSHLAGKHACVICSCCFTTLFGLEGHVTGVHRIKREHLSAMKEIASKEGEESSEKELADDIVQEQSDGEESGSSGNENDEGPSADPDTCGSPQTKTVDSEDEMPTLSPMADPVSVQSKEPDRHSSISILNRKIQKRKRKGRFFGKRKRRTHIVGSIAGKKHGGGRPRKLDTPNDTTQSNQATTSKNHKLQSKSIDPSDERTPETSTNLKTSSEESPILEDDSTNQRRSLYDRVKLGGRPPKRKTAEAASKMVKRMTETLEQGEGVDETPDENVRRSSRKRKSIALKYSESEDDKLADETNPNAGNNEDIEVPESLLNVRRSSRQRKSIKLQYADPEEKESTEIPIVERRKDADQNLEEVVLEPDPEPLPNIRRSSRKRKSKVIQYSDSENDEPSNETLNVEQEGISLEQSEPLSNEQNSTIPGSHRRSRKRPNLENDPGNLENPTVRNEPKISNAEADLEIISVSSHPTQRDESQNTEPRSDGRPPQRKSAKVAAKIIDDAMSTEFKKKQQQIQKGAEKADWLKEFSKFMCSRCGEGYDSNTLLTKHFQVCDNRSTNFICKVCFDGFPTLLRLKEHLWKSHKPRTNGSSASPISSWQTSREATPASSDGSKEKYICSLCKHELKDKRTLIMHMSVPHLFRCKRCPHVCDTKLLMDIHKKTAHRSKPQKSTAEPAQSATNTVVEKVKVSRPRICKCGYKFLRPSDQQNHMKDCKIYKTPTKPNQPAKEDNDEIVFLFECSPNKKGNEPQPGAIASGESAAPQKNTHNKSKIGPKSKMKPPVQMEPAKNVGVATKMTPETPAPTNLIEAAPELTGANDERMDYIDLDDSSDSNNDYPKKSTSEIGESPVAGLSEDVEVAECSESMICQDCGYLAFSVEDARDHYKSVGNNESMICDVCAYLASSSCDLKMHSKEHAPVDLQGSTNLPTVIGEHPPLQFEVEFRNDIGMEDLDEFNPVSVSHEVEVLTEDSFTFTENNADSGAVVIFDLSELQNI